jgi:hypothetical protein
VDRAREQQALKDLRADARPAAVVKAEHREASRKKYLSLPLSERIRIAASMVARKNRESGKRE